jgi:hypothetical protein
MVDDTATAWAVSPAGALRQLASEKIKKVDSRPQGLTIAAKNRDKVKPK